jgi:hypothetical protein
MRRGNVETVTQATRQSRKNAMTMAVTSKDRFCTMVQIRSAIADRTDAASEARHMDSMLLLLSSLSNQPISFFKIPAIYS